MKKARKILQETLTGALLVNIIWYIAAVTFNINVLPSPITVYTHLGEVLQNAMLVHLFASLERIVMGVGIAVILGLSIGLLMNSFRTADHLLGSLVYFTYPVPKLALLPVVMLLAGIGNATKVIMIVLIIIFQIIIATRDAARNIPQENYYIMTSLGSSPWKTLKNVTFPAILPDLLTTLRIAVGTAISVLFVTETYGTDKGMGYFIVDSWMRINYIDMYAGIVILSMMGFGLFLLIDLLESTLCKWKNKK